MPTPLSTPSKDSAAKNYPLKKYPAERHHAIRVRLHQIGLGGAAKIRLVKLSLNTPARSVCVLGLGLLMLGLGLDRHFGGVKLLQQVDSPGVFTLAIILAGPQLKWAS